MLTSRVPLMGLLLTLSTTAAAQGQVLFQSDVLSVGTILSVDHSDRLDVTLEASMEGMALPKLSLSEDSTLVGELHVLDAGRKGLESIRLHYTSGGTTSEFAEQVEQEGEEVVGHSYTVTLGGEALDIQREDGAAVSDAERDRIAVDVDALVDPLGDALPRRMTMGDTIDLGPWLDGVLDGAEELTAELSEIRGETAVFATRMRISGTDPDGITMDTAFAGELLVDTQTRRLISMTLEGPMHVSAEMDGVQLTGDGAGVIGMSHSLRYDPGVAKDGDLDMLALIDMAYSGLSSAERDAIRQRQQSRVDQMRQLVMTSASGEAKMMMMLSMADGYMMEGVQARQESEGSGAAWLRKAEKLYASLTQYPSADHRQLKYDMAMISLMLGDADQARLHAEESLSLATSPGERAETALLVAEAMVMAGDAAGAVPYFEQAASAPCALSAVAAYRLASVTGKRLRPRRVEDSTGAAPEYTFAVDHRLRESWL